MHIEIHKCMWGWKDLLIPNLSRFKSAPNMISNKYKPLWIRNKDLFFAIVFNISENCV